MPRLATLAQDAAQLSVPAIEDCIDAATIGQSANLACQRVEGAGTAHDQRPPRDPFRLGDAAGRRSLSARQKTTFQPRVKNGPDPRGRPAWTSTLCPGWTRATRSISIHAVSPLSSVAAASSAPIASGRG